MTHQDFNYIYIKFTGDPKGIELKDSIRTDGFEIKKFLEFAIKLYEEGLISNQTI